MLDTLDNYTLMVIIVLFATIYGVVLCSYAKFSDLFRGFWRIGLGFLSVAFGFALVLIESQVFANLIIIFSAFFVINAVKLVGIGGLHFFESDHSWYKTISNWLMVVQLLAFSYFIFLQPSIAARTAIICSILSALCFCLAFQLVKVRVRNKSLPLKLLYFLAIICGFSFLGRAIWAVVSEQQGAHFEVELVAQTGALLAFIMMLIFTSLILIWSAGDTLQNELLQQATIDSLTKCYNRRALELIAEKEVSNAKRENKPLTLMLIDIDHFKRINDLHGHPFGDQVLKQFAELMQYNLRANDIFARFGGEEFVVLLPNTPSTGAIKLSEKLRQVTKDTPFSSLDGSVKETITISIGLCECDVKSLQWSSFLSQTDKALYAAKHQGRDRVVSFESIDT